jgi:hypothetical protein
MSASGLLSASAQLADDVCLRELALIETSYGKLVYLAGLINLNTSCYEHYNSKGTRSLRSVTAF